MEQGKETEKKLYCAFLVTFLCCVIFYLQDLYDTLPSKDSEQLMEESKITFKTSKQECKTKQTKYDKQNKANTV